MCGYPDDVPGRTPEEIAEQRSAIASGGFVNPNNFPKGKGGAPPPQGGVPPGVGADDQKWSKPAEPKEVIPGPSPVRAATTFGFSTRPRTQAGVRRSQGCSI